MSYKEYTVRVFENGAIHWYSNGRLSRDNGPAIEYPCGCKYWYKDGKPHRIDGPACECIHGDKFWYVDGKRLTEEEFTRSQSNG